MWPFSTEVNAMHPYVTELLARAHHQELERCDVSPRSFAAHAATCIDRAEFGVTASRGTPMR
jgi:hypothetical protein